MRNASSISEIFGAGVLVDVDPEVIELFWVSWMYQDFFANSIAASFDLARTIPDNSMRRVANMKYRIVPTRHLSIFSKNFRALRRQARAAPLM